MIVSVSGELDMATVPQLRAYLRDKTASRPAHLVLDLSGVTFLAAHGVDLFMTARDGHKGIHGELHLTGVAATEPCTACWSSSACWRGSTSTTTKTTCCADWPPTDSALAPP